MRPKTSGKVVRVLATFSSSLSLPQACFSGRTRDARRAGKDSFLNLFAVLDSRRDQHGLSTVSLSQHKNVVWEISGSHDKWHLPPVRVGHRPRRVLGRFALPSAFLPRIQE
jgi:hypothetical protein